MPATYTDARDGLTTSVAVKAPCRAATTANITLSGAQTIDGVACVSGDRVLVKNQTSAIDNGIWVVGAGAWSRALDFDGALDAVDGSRVFVNVGTLNANTEWVVTTDNPLIIGTSEITFALVASLRSNRRRIDENTTLYVRHDGSDDNTGISDDANNAFATMQGAANYVMAALDLGLYDIDIEVQTSVTPYAGVSVETPFVGNGRVTFKCSATQSSVIVDDTICFEADGARFYIEGGFEIRGTEYGINATNSGWINFSGTVFGACGSHIRSTRNSYIECLTTYYVNGSATANHLRASAGGIISMEASTLVFNSNASFGVFAYASLTSRIYYVLGASINLNSKTVTGQRYTVWENSIIQWIGGTAASLPGNADGEELAGGRYCISTTETDNATGSFSIDPSTATTTVVTGLGFKPGFVDFLCAVSGLGGKTASIGWANLKAALIPAAANSHAVMADNGNVTPDTTTINDTQCIKHYTDGSNRISAQVTAVGSDGFTLTWTKVGTPASASLLITWKARRSS